jgi:acetoin utilization protein AcuB
MLVRHFMTSEVVSLSPDQTCEQALAELRRNTIRRAPVLEGHRLVGIISERDLLRILPGTCGQASTIAGEDCLHLAVRHVMQTEVITLNPNDHLAAAASLMLKHRIGGVPVVRDGNLKGIITESDIFKAFYGILTSGKGCTLLFEEAPHAPGASADYAGLCSRRGCRLRTLLRYVKPSGGAIYFLCIEGDGVDAFIADVWALSHQVIAVEKA